MFRGRKAVRYPRGITHMRGREVETVIAEDTATLTEDHPRPFQLGAGHMTDWELSNLHGEITQTVPLEERDRHPQEIQVRGVGSGRWKAVGRGHRGRNTVSFYHPERSDTLTALDTASGNTVHVSAPKLEKKRKGQIHAMDFPEKSKADIAAASDPAHVQGTALSAIKGTSREHWPLPDRRPQRTHTRTIRASVDESDVPWNAPGQPKPDVLHFMRYVVGSGSGSGNRSTPK